MAFPIRLGGSSLNHLSTLLLRHLGKSKWKAPPPPSRTISTGPSFVVSPKSPLVKRSKAKPTSPQPPLDLCRL
eukprot:4951749-Heterocapsa_arctica.AAC.1